MIFISGKMTINVLFYFDRVVNELRCLIIFDDMLDNITNHSYLLVDQIAGHAKYMYVSKIILQRFIIIIIRLVTLLKTLLIISQRIIRFRIV